MAPQHVQAAATQPPPVPQMPPQHVQAAQPPQVQSCYPQAAPEEEGVDGDQLMLLREHLAKSLRASQKAFTIIDDICKKMKPINE
jgi:hypothetical protein